MNAEMLSITLNVIQTIVIVCSLAGLVWQLRQIRRTILSTDDYKTLDFYVHINEIRLSKPRLLDYFHTKGIELKDDEEKEAYLYLSLMMSYFEYIFYLYKEKRIDKESWQSWERWVIETILPSILFKKFWEHEQIYWNESFTKYIDKEHSKLLLSLAKPMSSNLNLSKSPE